jgi:YidC/Oxa1 family membrane protein insertase
MSELWNGLMRGLGDILIWFHDLVEPVTGVFAWGWAIILLTIAVRIILLPLAIKQTSSMRSMQTLSPEIKRIQAKYKADRGLMRSDPQKYQELRQRQQEEVQKLYRERGVNPAASCLPLLAQMPIFIALFNVLRNADIVPQLQDATWYAIDRLSLGATNGAGIGAWLLIALMGATTFLSQRQMMASNPTMVDNQQQRVMLYVMPIMLTVFGINFPTGVLLYWVTTNLWTMAQQRIMFRRLGPVDTAAKPPAAEKTESEAPKARDASAPKGVPTPKRDETRKNRTAAQNSSGNGRAKTKPGRGKGGSTASSKQRRG